MMKRKMMAAAALCAVMVLASGCGTKKQDAAVPVQTQVSAEETTAAVSTEAASTEIKEAAATDETEAKGEAKAETEKEMTGVIDENKGFMIIVVSDEDKEAYVFSIEDETMVKELKEGDKVIITYEGDPSPDSDFVRLISVKKQ